MAVLTGAQALKRIVEFEELKSIPIAFFTTGKLGAEEYLTTHHARVFLKPSTYDHYLQTIKEILYICEYPRTNIPRIKMADLREDFREEQRPRLALIR